jgi:hypothetical protein
MTKPTRNSKWKRASVFVYENTTTSPKSILLNRTPTAATTMFFTDLVITGAVNRAGAAKFTVVNTGSGSTAEWSLFDDSVVAESLATKQKFVAIIVGSDVVWTGKILRSTNTTQATYYTTSSRLTVWEVECESDIGKMKLSSVTPPTPATITGSVGEIVSSLVDLSSGGTDWTGLIAGATPIYMSVISNEGAPLTYKISDSDRYSQFMALAKLSGFEWRTRLQNYTGTYDVGGWDGTTLTNGSSATFTPYIADSFKDRFVLLSKNNFTITTNKRQVQSHFADWADDVNLFYPLSNLYELVVGDRVTLVTDVGNVPTGLFKNTLYYVNSVTLFGGDPFYITLSYTLGGANITFSDDGTYNFMWCYKWNEKQSTGVSSYGYCTGNTTTAITLTDVVNPPVSPTPNGWFTVLMDPLLDFSWDLEQPVPVQTIRVNSKPDGTYFFGYNFNDKTDKKTLATRVTVKAKNIDTSDSTTGKSSTISTTLEASNKWEAEDCMFENCSVVTNKMDGYIHSYTAGATVMYLIGTGYALNNPDVFDVYMRFAGASAPTWNIGAGGGYTVSATPTLFYASDGTALTQLVFTPAINTPTANAAKYSVLCARKAYVQDKSRLVTAGYIGGATPIIFFFGGGSVTKTVTTEGTDATYGDWVSGTKGGTDVYPILPGCFVKGPGSFGSPSINPIVQNGTLAITETVDHAITRGELEQYATQSLINHSFYLRKASLLCFITDFLKPGARGVNQLYDWQMIKEGDRIAVAPDSDVATGSGGKSLNDLWYDGQSKYKWEVVSWTLDCTTMKVSIELGDYEPNVFSLMNSKTAALDRTIT